MNEGFLYTGNIIFECYFKEWMFMYFKKHKFGIDDPVTKYPELEIL